MSENWCETCKWFMPPLPGDRESVTGECRRYPPSFLPNANNGSPWPLTRTYEWCGEWKDRTEPIDE